MAKALVTATTTARQEKASEIVDGPCNEGCWRVQYFVDKRRVDREAPLSAAV